MNRRSALVLFVVLATFPVLPAHAADRVTGRDFATRSEVIARHGMAATSQPLATQIALDILKQGGNAIDAAIAANAALGLMEPTGERDGGRSLCHRVGCKDPEALRAERQRPFSHEPHSRGVQEARPGKRSSPTVPFP